MSAEDDAINLASRRKAKAIAATTAIADGRPTINLIVGEERGRIVDECEAALLASGIPLYKQGGRIIRVVLDKIKVAGGGDGEILRLSTVTEPHILECFEKSAHFIKWSKTESAYVGAHCPDRTSSSYLARDGQWALPYLMGVVTCPTLRADGSILDVPGYDVATGLVYDPGTTVFPPQIQNPTRDDAIGALEMLSAPIASFPFVTPADKTVALSGMLTSVLRRAMPTAPMHAFTAPVAGAGKSMLVDLAAIIATGEHAAVMTTGKDNNSDAELEKRLTASMLAGDAVLSLDNIEGLLGGEMLCALMTQPRVKLRPLGRSINIDVPITTAFFATSNNLSVVGDMTRRVLVAKMDPGVERPEQRSFDFDPIAMVKANRGELVKAVITIARAWLISGEKAPVSALGSYDHWSNMVRNALIWVGLDDPVSVMDATRETDPRLTKLRDLAIAWWEKFRNQFVTVADVVGAAMDQFDDAGRGDDLWKNKDLRSAVIAVSASGDQQHIRAEKLAWWLRKNSGRFINGVRFVKQDGGKYACWGLEGTLNLDLGVDTVVAEGDLPF